MASTVAAEVGGSVADDVAGMAAENALAKLLAVVAVGPGLPGEGWVGLAMGARGRDVAEIMGAGRVIATVLAGMAADMKEMAELLADVAVGPGLGGSFRYDYGRSSGRSRNGGRCWAKRSAQ